MGLVTSGVMRTSPVVSVPPWYEDTPEELERQRQVDGPRQVGGEEDASP